MDDAFRVKSEYAKYRIERAKEDLDVAVEMFNEDHFRIANNRAYYSIFHSMSVFADWVDCSNPTTSGHWVRAHDLRSRSEASLARLL